MWARSVTSPHRLWGGHLPRGGGHDPPVLCPTARQSIRGCRTERKKKTRSYDGGWWVTDGGWWVTKGGWWVATKNQRVDAIIKKKRVSVLMAPPAKHSAPRCVSGTTHCHRATHTRTATCTHQLKGQYRFRYRHTRMRVRACLQTMAAAETHATQTFGDAPGNELDRGVV